MMDFGWDDDIPTGKIISFPIYTFYTYHIYIRIYIYRVYRDSLEYIGETSTEEWDWLRFTTTRPWPAVLATWYVENR